MVSRARKAAPVLDAKALIHNPDVGLPEKAVPVCLAGDLQVAFEQAEQELEEAQAKRSDSLAGNREQREIALRIEDLREKMKRQTIEFHFRAMPGKKWRALKEKHPPRKAEDGSVEPRDRGLGANIDTLLPAVERLTLFEPQLDDHDWDVLEDKLTSNQLDTLAGAVWLLNERDIDIPFSHAASKILRSGSE